MSDELTQHCPCCPGGTWREPEWFECSGIRAPRPDPLLDAASALERTSFAERFLVAQWLRERAKNQTSHASAPGGPLPTRGDDAGGDGAVRDPDARVKKGFRIGVEAAARVVERTGDLPARDLAQIIRALAAGVGRGGPVTEALSGPPRCNTCGAAIFSDPDGTKHCGCPR